MRVWLSITMLCVIIMLTKKKKKHRYAKKKKKKRNMQESDVKIKKNREIRVIVPFWVTYAVVIWVIFSSLYTIARVGARFF